MKACKNKNCGRKENKAGAERSWLHKVRDALFNEGGRSTLDFYLMRGYRSFLQWRRDSLKGCKFYDSLGREYSPVDIRITSTDLLCKINSLDRKISVGKPVISWEEARGFGRKNKTVLTALAYAGLVIGACKGLSCLHEKYSNPREDRRPVPVWEVPNYQTERIQNDK